MDGWEAGRMSLYSNGFLENWENLEGIEWVCGWKRVREGD